MGWLEVGEDVGVVLVAGGGIRWRREWLEGLKLLLPYSIFCS